jgi:hypothetical protein
MNNTSATTQLQAWLDGHTSVLSKSAVRTVLWDLAEAQTQLEQFVSAGVLAEVWYYTDDDEGSSSEVYPDVDTAKAAAIADLEALDPGAVTGEEQYTWRTVEKLPDYHLLDEDGRFTGWSVNRLRVAAPVAKAGA